MNIMNVVNAAVVRITRRPTTERAIAGFEKSIDMLSHVADAEGAKIDRLKAEIADKQVAVYLAAQRRERAARLHDKLAELVA